MFYVLKKDSNITRNEPMTTYLHGQNVVFTNNSSSSVINLSASAGKTLSISTGTLQITNRPSVVFTGTTSSSNTITNNTWTAINNTNMWTSSALTGSGIVPTNGSLLITNASLYIVSAQLGFTQNTTGDRGISVYKNGTSSAMVMTSRANAEDTMLNLSVPLNLVANDVLTLYAHQDSGGSLGINGLQGAYFSAYKL